MNDQDYQELKATVSSMEHLIGKANTIRLLETFAQPNYPNICMPTKIWTEGKRALMREFLDRYQEEEAELSGNMADIILRAENRREYDACLSYITDAYIRMSTNRDPAYRDKQMEVTGKMLDRMTQLLEGAASTDN